MATQKAVAVKLAHPVQTLREHSTSFEAALAVCLAEPKVRAVHKLRTESRRLEAQVALLKAVPQLPPFRAEAAKALSQIKKLRRAAGRVRDLDVQTGHLQDHTKKVHTGSSSEAEEHEADKQQALADLDLMITKRAERRTRAAAMLTTEITARQAKVAAALEKLIHALKPAARRSLLSKDLLAIAERQFARTPALKRRNPSADDLHTVRKAAKQTRYLAENGGSAPAIAAAKRYEHLQELGGDWHDWLDLAAAARKELGKKHTITTQFLALRNHNLERFRTELTNFLPAADVKAKPAKKEPRQKFAVAPKSEAAGTKTSAPKTKNQSAA